MNPVIAEIDSLLELLEAEIPANPKSPANEKRANRLEKDIKDYFNSLEQAFPYDKVEQIYLRYVKE